jgi:hypothetical protein
MELHLQAQTDLVAPGVGDDPDNPDLQYSTSASEAAGELGLESLRPLGEEEMAEAGLADEGMATEGIPAEGMPEEGL